MGGTGSTGRCGRRDYAVASGVIRDTCRTESQMQLPLCQYVGHLRANARQTGAGCGGDVCAAVISRDRLVADANAGVNVNVKFINVSTSKHGRHGQHWQV